MKMNKHYLFMLQIVILFGIIILGSFIPEMFPDFFGDWKCQGTHNGCKYGINVHTATTHWGFRHFLYFFMGVSLFLYNLCLIAENIENYVKEINKSKENNEN